MRAKEAKVAREKVAKVAKEKAAKEAKEKPSLCRRGWLWQLQQVELGAVTIRA